MTVSIPSPTIYAGSTISDITRTVGDLVINCQSLRITKGMEVRDGTQIFSYEGEDFTPEPYDENNENYNVGDIVLHACKLYKISGKQGNKSYIQYIPKEPEEYDGWDSGIAFNTWSHRYVRFANKIASNECLGHIGYYQGRWYYFFKDSCGYKFSAKDLRLLGCGYTCYLSTCLAPTTAYAYNSAKDVAATTTEWCGTSDTATAGCPQRSTCGGGTIYTGDKVPTLNLKSIVIRGDYIYARTHLSDAQAPMQYHEIPIDGTIKYTLSEVQHPTDIDGFTYKRNINALSVFDGKDYTTVETSPPIELEEWYFYNTQQIDTIAFGNIIAEGVSIVITDKDGHELFNLYKHPVKNDLSNDRFQIGVTHIVYTSQKITEESLIKVTLHGVNLQLGDIVVGDKLDMGFTNLAFKNDFKDFSPYEQDQWGNIVYIDGVRVKRHSGTVDLPTPMYDMMVRQAGFIGGKEVIINGSDSLSNTPSNSINIFQATMMIGRFKTLRLQTAAKSNKQDETSTYTFEIEERV